MTWVVFDYGGVLCHPPTEEAGAALAAAAGTTVDRFWPAYWAHRTPYDLGVVSAAEFWTKVCGDLGRPSVDDEVERLVDLDNIAWFNLNQGTSDLLRELSEADVPLALLSNAPVDLARVIDTQPWAGRFQHRFFSADLKLAKPDPAVYRRLCTSLGAGPGEVMFVDDREDNVLAARELGIDALLFTDVGRLRADLAKRGTS
ncbi:haloacid dehalogenase [Longimycelium tulufanense]|uniref:Haloacid dehalogenase n=1 Tax=Longimycelium tulufanense TaxID=907463 RepID=A0A8J3CJV6_9PSEU|nr:HAD family phosphatase [Longimycelium tulufanense]GGM80327.1 haloacid dehalogenase [Longimycelium tulufanense]